MSPLPSTNRATRSGGRPSRDRQGLQSGPYALTGLTGRWPQPGGRGGSGHGDRRLERFAADIGLSYKTVETYWWTSARWPAEHRQAGVSHTVHKVLGSIEEERRFATILAPPLNERTGVNRWTPDAAKGVLSWQVATPVTVQEKIEQVHKFGTCNRPGKREVGRR